MKVRLALAGLGRWAMLLYQFLLQVDQAEVVAGYDRDPAAAARATRVFGLPAATSLDRILKDPTIQAVLVATGNDMHLPVARRCLAAGKDVFVEKPVTNRVADADRLIQAAAAGGRVLMVGHNSRRYPAVRKLKELLDGGRIGRVRSLEATFSYPNLDEIRTPTWRNDPRKCPGGPLLQLGVHQADNLLYLHGPVQQVWGELYGPIPGARVPPGGRLLLRFATGALGAIVSDYCTAPEVFRITVRGEAGEAEAVGENLVRLAGARGGTTELPAGGPDSLQAELAEFVDCVRTRRAPETDGVAGREALRIILAGLESARRRRPVTLA